MNALWMEGGRGGLSGQNAAQLVAMALSTECGPALSQSPCMVGETASASPHRASFASPGIVLWTVHGSPGTNGLSAAPRVEEESSSEPETRKWRDMEEGSAKVPLCKTGPATHTSVQLMECGRPGPTGCSAPCLVGMGRSVVRGSAFPRSTEARTALARQWRCRSASSCIVPCTASGCPSQSGPPAAPAAMEESAPALASSCLQRLAETAVPETKGKSWTATLKPAQTLAMTTVPPVTLAWPAAS